MKKILKNPILMTIAALMMVLLPVMPAMAAPEWNCNSVIVASVNQTTKQVIVNLDYSHNLAEKAQVTWGDGSITTTVHALNSGTYSTTASHNYTNYGSYTITMYVWGAGTQANQNNQCHTQVLVDPTYCTNQGAGYKLTLTPLQHTTGTSYTTTATFSYDVVNASDYGKISWGQSGTTTTLSAGDKVNGTSSHTYTGTGPFTVTLSIYNSSNVYQSKCTVVTSGAPAAVTISTITADPIDTGYGWGTFALAGLGLVTLGGVVLLAARKR